MSMIPFFEAGGPVSAGKFNALGDSIRALAGGGSAAGEMMVPQHFDSPPRPDMDFAVMYRKDDNGSWGWCCHKGRVIVKGKEHPAGEEEWKLVADDAYTGDIKLVVTLDDKGEFSNATIEQGTPAEGSDTTKEFPLATIDKELIWKHSGGPVYVIEPTPVLKAGKGIEIKEEEGESGSKEKKLEISALIEDAATPSDEEYSLIYADSEGGEGGGGGGEKNENKGDPYKLKLLATSDDSVSITDGGEKLYITAKSVQPGDGLEWKMEEDAQGNQQQTNIIQVKIDSAVSSDGESGKLAVDLSVSPQGLKGEVELTVDSTKQTLGDGSKINLAMADGILSLSVESGEPQPKEELSFRAPLRKNGNFVVLDYDQTWSEQVNGMKVHLTDMNGQLAVELHAETEPDGTDSLFSDSWTALACDSDHALRLNRDEKGRLYIQQGEWSSGNYTPMN